MRWIVAVCGIGVLLVSGAVFFPDAALTLGWKHFTGPIYADALNQQSVTWEGITAYRGYTYVNEIVYALLVVMACFSIFRWLDASDVVVDDEFTLTFIPFIVFGGLLRVVEDAGVLPFELRVFLVSPLGYFLVLGVAVATFAVASKYRERIGGWKQGVWVTGAFASACCVGVLLFTQTIDRMAAVLLTGGSIVAVVLAYGLLVMARSFVPENRFVWQRSGTAAVTGHTLDGAVTSLSIAYLGYGEKHPLSQAVMDMAGTPFGFLAVKLMLILGIVSVIRYDEDETFTRLMMLAIIVVGLGPAVRSGTRALFGV